MIQVEQKDPLNPQDLINKLNLNTLLPDNSGVEDTKNLLRNFGNAQNHYCLYNPTARKIIERNIEDPQKFDNWVRKLKLDNFWNYHDVWSCAGGSKYFLFTRVYKELCWLFYS